jgi:hypothetical protein
VAVVVVVLPDLLDQVLQAVMVQAVLLLVAVVADLMAGLLGQVRLQA